jgi:hypothetical protein
MINFSLHYIVEPTCTRHRSAKRDASKSSHGDDGFVVLDEEGEAQGEALPQHPSRPHGSFKEYVLVFLL